uniref:Uncharacterized protein n=1 Tax=Oryza glumipatula TaxID=40148 RepID=A0A0E0BDR5_9ORYZ
MSVRIRIYNNVNIHNISVVNVKEVDLLIAVASVRYLTEKDRKVPKQCPNPAKGRAGSDQKCCLMIIKHEYHD